MGPSIGLFLEMRHPLSAGSSGGEVSIGERDVFRVVRSIAAMVRGCKFSYAAGEGAEVVARVGVDVFFREIARPFRGIYLPRFALSPGIYSGDILLCARHSGVC